MGEGEVNGEVGDATAVVTEDIFTRATYVATDGMCDESNDAVTVVEGAGTVKCILAFPCPVAGVDAGTDAGVITGQSAGVFTKMSDD